MKEFYTYLYKTAGMDIGTPLKAYKYAIQKMRESKNQKYFQRIKEDAEIIKFINEHVEYAETPVFSSSELGKLHNFNPKEYPRLG